MIEHLEESTNTVKSNKKLIAAVAVNIVFLAVLIAFYGIIPDNRYFMAGIFSLAVIWSSALLYQIIRKF